MKQVNVILSRFLIKCIYTNIFAFDLGFNYLQIFVKTPSSSTIWM